MKTKHASTNDTPGVPRDAMKRNHHPGARDGGGKRSLRSAWNDSELVRLLRQHNFDFTRLSAQLGIARSQAGTLNPETAAALLLGMGLLT